MANIAELFAANVPRYTSYPTAPHFHDGIDERGYRQWLADLPAQTPLSLYLHIPFCDTLCWFCGCHTSVVNHYRPVQDYVGLLIRELRLVARALPRRHPVRHIHWGGGSPTMLRPADIERLDAAIREHFDVEPEAEFAIEIDPRGLDAVTVRALAAAGLTRASIGLQDRDIAVQKAINRVQSDAETQAALEMLRAEGIKSFNLDLVYGLPRQTAESWEATLDFALDLAPARLAIFGYAHVPQFKKHQALIPSALLPGLESRFRMAERTWERAQARGYVPIGLDHFAMPGDALARAARQGTLRRNFQGYTADDAPALLGFGASAIGALPQGYVQNAVSVPAYRALVEADQLPVHRGVALTERDRLHRRAIECLMCDLRVALDDVAGEGADFFAGALARLQPLARDGVLSIEDANVVVNPQWRAAVRLVAAAFDEYLPRAKSLHSASV